MLAYTYVEPGKFELPEKPKPVLMDQLVGDILATDYWAADIAEISAGDTVLILSTAPTGICTLQCVLLKESRRVIICEKRPLFRNTTPQFLEFVQRHSDHGGADAVLEVAGSEDTFRLAWQCTRPNTVVTVVALYERYVQSCDPVF